jgi:hypothetical protein
MFMGETPRVFHHCASGYLDGEYGAEPPLVLSRFHDFYGRHVTAVVASRHDDERARRGSIT